MTTAAKKIKKARPAKLLKKVPSRSRKNPSAFFGKLKDGIDGLTYQKKLRRKDWPAFSGRLMSIRVKPKKGTTRWVAIDSRNKIISEGSNPNSVSKKAEKITADFSLAFIPKEDVSYVL